MNAKRIYRLYTEKADRSDQAAQEGSAPAAGAASLAVRPDQCWSMDFVSDRLNDGRTFRILTVVDQFTRSVSGSSQTGR